MTKRKQTLNWAGMPNLEKDNLANAKRAGTALLKYQNESGVDLEDAVGDPLADLMHWCDVHGQDFENVLRLGRMHYDDEKWK